MRRSNSMNHSTNFLRTAVAILGTIICTASAIHAQQVGDFYAIDFTDSLRRIDPVTLETLETTPITGLQSGNDVVACAFDSASCNFMIVGKIAGVTPTVLYTLDEQTGVATVIGTITSGGTGYSISDLSFAPDGTLWGISGVVHDNQIVTIDTTTAEVTVVGNSGMTGGGNALSWGPGGTLFSVDSGSFYTVDPATGVATVLAVAPTSIVGTLSWDGVSPTLTSLDAAFSGEVNTVTTDGTATVVGLLSPIALSCGLVRECATGGRPEFLRGDCDNDGTFSGLLDALRALNFQFLPGSPPPTCLEACDADDDGAFSGLIDGLRMLNFQFVPGTPPPPAPGATVCGPDPDPGTTLGCDEPNLICNP